tara:strand:- start:1051 stop:1476 length:426 start_codon:yes stop_codon:yes gene_type:complete
LNKKTFILSHNLARYGACALIKTVPEGYVCTIQKPSRGLKQNALIHALVSDISKQCKFSNQKLSSTDWKRLLIDGYARIKADEGEPLSGWGRVLPNLDYSGVVQLGIQSRNFTKKQASEFCEYLYAWGADNNVEWSDKNGF